MPDKKKIIKIIISIFFCIRNTGKFVYFSYLHLFLTKGLDEIKIFSISQAIKY